MIRETLVPAIPDIRGDNIIDALKAIKSTIDVREGSVGDPLDQVVTMRELAALNLASASGTTTTDYGGTIPVLTALPRLVDNYNPSTDYTTPPQPTGLRATGGFTNVFLQWDGAPYRNHAYTEIWRAQTDNLGAAILVGTTNTNVYADPAQTDATYYYWIRFVSLANITGAYNATSGTMATTAIDVKSALPIIANEIASSQLFIDLGTRISSIESDPYFQSLTSGGYKYQIDRLTQASDTAHSQISYVKSVTATQATTLGVLSSTLDQKSKVFFQSTAPTSTTAYTLKAGDVWYDTGNNNKSYRWSGSAWVAFVNASKVYYQGTAPTSTTASPLFVGDLWFNSSDSNRQYRWNGASWDSVRDGYIDARVTTLEQTKIGYATLNSTGLVFDNNGSIVDAATTAAYNSSNPYNQATWHIGLPFASAVKQVAVSDGVSTLTLEQRFTAQKSTNDTLYGQYTVKIDNNGHVSGFGLASGAVNGTPTSAFIIRADRFAIVGASDTSNGLGTLDPTSKPFIVLTTPTTVSGKTYPAGTWIDTAFIANATIDTAKISDLTADKITTGTLTATINVNSGSIYGGVNPNGYALGSIYTGTGYFLGAYGGTNQFFIGSPDKNLLWNGTDLTIKGIIYASAGSIGGAVMDAIGIHSPNYINGLQGWAIKNNDTAEFVNATFRGDVIVGSVPAISSVNSTIMTGSGVRMYNDGRVAMGNGSASMVWNNSGLYINGLLNATTASVGGFVRLEYGGSPTDLLMFTLGRGSTIQFGFNGTIGGRTTLGTDPQIIVQFLLYIIDTATNVGVRYYYISQRVSNIVSNEFIHFQMQTSLAPGSYKLQIVPYQASAYDTSGNTFYGSVVYDASLNFVQMGGVNAYVYQAMIG